MATHHPAARRGCALGIAGLLSLAATSVFASGFALIEQSVSSMGTAYAGAGSAAIDASQVFFNPAGMSRLEGQQLSAGVHVVLPGTEFSGGNSYNANNPVFMGGPLGGLAGLPVGSQGDGGDAGVTGYVPHFTYVTDYNDKIKLGLTINAPFGLKTEYDGTWAGRYSAIESEIVTVNINPAISFEVNDTTTVGFGISAMYAELKLQNAVDDCLLSNLAMSPIPGCTLYPHDDSFDAVAQHKLDDWGYGFNLGLLYEPDEQTRFGIAYRSKVDVDLSGNLVTNSLVVSSKGAHADVTLPDTLLLSAYHEVSPKTAVMADVQWTHWSKIPQLMVNYSDGSSNTFHLSWENTIRVAIGASYRYDDKWTLRTGLAYDETPVPGPTARIAALPDEDRLWLSFGAGYKYTRNLTFDFGYAHLFIDDTSIDNSDADSSAIPGSNGLHQLTGRYNASVDIVSAQANWKF